MATKYYIPFKSYDDIDWQIHINSDNYVGDAIGVRGVLGQAAVLSYDGDTDDPFSVFIKSTLNINIYNEGKIDINELQQSQDREWKIKVYRSGNLYWSGFLLNESIQYPVLSAPTTLTLSATCGLSLLDDLDYSDTGFPLYSRTPLNYFRQILFNNLGITLPIRWTNTLQCTAFIGQDVFAGGVQWSVNKEGIYSYQSGSDGDLQGPVKSCGYILEGLLKAFQCRIFQANGVWVIRRINDYVSGSFEYKQISGDLNPILIQSGTENVLKTIGRFGYPFLNEDQLITSKQGIKTARVTYAANVRNNLLPNGNQDLITSINEPLYWSRGISGPGFALSDQSTTPLDNRPGGFATFVNNIGEETNYFTLVTPGSILRKDGLPIDTLTMVQKINFGFTFSPQFGFPTDPTTHFIIWDDKPFQIQVIFNAGSVVFYLNEFGYWQTDPIFISITVDALQLKDVATINFDKFQGIIMPSPDAQPIAGDTSDIQILFVAFEAQGYILDNIYITFDGGNDVYESTLADSKNTTVEETELEISSSFGGYQLSNLMTSWVRSDVECFYREGLAFENTLTAITAYCKMKFRYKASKIYNGTMNVRDTNWSFDEVYMIDSFDSLKFLGLNAKYNIEKCEVFLIAMESRSDNNVIFTEKYYNSNDNQLSN